MVESRGLLNVRVDQEEEVPERVIEEKLKDEIQRIGYNCGNDDKVEVDLRRRKARRTIPADLTPTAHQNALLLITTMREPRSVR